MSLAMAEAIAASVFLTVAITVGLCALALMWFNRRRDK